MGMYYTPYYINEGHFWDGKYPFLLTVEFLIRFHLVETHDFDAYRESTCLLSGLVLGKLLLVNLL